MLVLTSTAQGAVAVACVFSVFVCALVAYVAVSAWQRKKDIPNAPWKLCVIESLLRLPRVLRLPPFNIAHNIDNAVREAMRQTKLSDLGASQASFYEAYRIAYQTKYMHPDTRRFSTTGELAATFELVGVAKRRLLVTEYLKQHPEIRDRQIRRPIIMLGLARSGTTFLHRMVSTDPRFRAPLTWELQTPVPIVDSTEPDALAADRKARLARADEVMAGVVETTGDLLTNIHELDTLAPEECLISLGANLPLTAHLLPAFCFAWKQFLLDQPPPMDAYRDHADLLRLLQAQKPNDERQWLLKCPLHASFIEVIEEVFPDAIIVMNLRSPVKAVPSLASLMRALHNMFMEPRTWDGKAMGATLLDMTEVIVQRAMDALAKTKLRHTFVRYDELVEDPVGTVRKMYDDIGIEFTTAAQQSLNEHLAQDAAKRASLKGNKQALHAYSPEEFGLSAEQIEQRLRGYMEHFQIPFSTKQ